MKEQIFEDHGSRAQSVALDSWQPLSDTRPDVRQEHCMAKSFFDEREEYQVVENHSVVGNHTRQDTSFTTSDENGPETSQCISNGQDHSPHSPRKYFIRKGRERLERTRGASARHSNGGDKKNGLDYPFCLSQDDESYKDDLRRSVLEDDWESNQAIDSTKHAYLRGMELREASLSVFESTKHGENSARQIVFGAISGNDGVLKSLHRSIKNDSIGEVVETRVEGGHSIPTSVDNKLLDWRLGPNSDRGGIPEISEISITELRRRVVRSSNAESKKSTTQLSSGEVSKIPGRSSPPLNQQKLKLNDTKLPFLQYPSMRRREEMDMTGGSSPVARNKRISAGPQFAPISNGQSEKMKMQKSSARDMTAQTLADVKLRTQERLCYLKNWLRERETKNATTSAYVLSAQKNNVTEEKPRDLELKKALIPQESCSFRSAPSLDEGDYQGSHQKETNFDRSQTSLHPKESILVVEPKRGAAMACEQRGSRKLVERHPCERETIVTSYNSAIAAERGQIRWSNAMPYPKPRTSIGIYIEERESREECSSTLRSLACPDSISSESLYTDRNGQEIDHRSVVHAPQLESDLTRKKWLVRQRESLCLEESVNESTVNDEMVQATENEGVECLPTTGLGTEVYTRTDRGVKKCTRDQENTTLASLALTGSFPHDPEDSAARHTVAQREAHNPLDIQVVSSTPKLRKSSKAFTTPNGDDSINLSVSYSDGNSFETRAADQDELAVLEIPIWRMDPLESLSDFILQIQNKESGETSTYHVHRHIIACGPRRSKHLHEVFHSSDQSSAHFVLGGRATEVFTCMLDHIYCHDYELAFTTENVMVYRNIGKKFQIDSLIFKTTRFIHEDMQVSNMTTYITAIDTHKDQNLRKLVKAKCAENIELISVLDSLWILMDPDLFFGTISCPLIDREKTSPYLSILVKEYTSLHMHEMSEGTFLKLTSPNILPTIDRRAALPLLEICFSYGSPKMFEPLQERCACTMASYWKITSENDRQRLFALLRNLPSSFTVDFLEKVETGKASSLVSTNSQALTDDNSKNEKLFSRDKIDAELEVGDAASTHGTQSFWYSWRTDPVSSYSDWTIQVKHVKYDTVDVYNVHKHILAVGRYKSGFFSEIFLSSDSKVCTKGMTTVALDHIAAEAFPQMLNFMYSRGNAFDVSRETAVALRFLARAFKVWDLNKKIIHFVESDMSVSNVLQYIDDADSFNDEVVAEVAIQFCACNITMLDVDSKILDSLEPAFFGRIVRSSALDQSPLATCHVPTIIAKFFVLHRLDERLLEDVLQEYDVEKLDCLNALKLLQIICVLESKDSKFFMDLRNRCTDILTQNWNELRDTFRTELFAIFLTLDTETVTRIFNRVEKNNYDTLCNIRKEQSNVLMEYETQLVDVRDDHEAVVTKVKKRMQAKFETIAAKQEDLEKELKEKDDAKALLAAKKIPIVIGAVSSLSEDTNVMKGIQTESGWSMFSCSPGIPS